MSKTKAFFWPDYRKQRIFHTRELWRGRGEATKVLTGLNGIWDIEEENASQEGSMGLGMLRAVLIL